ncbi:MAG: hypothetical protein QQW96_03570 [Tychonema bourrellyi B0820]|nr:hypothetical protein [Tychonema bourrellyi B0820]
MQQKRIGEKQDNPNIDRPEASEIANDHKFTALDKRQRSPLLCKKDY